VELLCREVSLLKDSFTEDVDTQGEMLPNSMGCNSDYVHQEQYIENCNEYGNYQNDISYQHNSSYDNNYGQLATPHSSLGTSRQNSYEREERQNYDMNHYYNGQYLEDSPIYVDGAMNEGGDYDDGALYYNSRPMQ
jgi:hypothetical protein